MMAHRWIAIGGVLALAGDAGAATLGVPSEYPTIQAGVDAASPGDTVLVAPGTYSDHQVRPVEGGVARSCVFLKGGVVLRSEGGPKVTTIHLPDDTVQPQVLYGQYLPTDDTVVEGFSLTAVPTGYSAVYVIGSGKVTFRDCEFRDLEGFITNAGLNVNSGDVDVLACRFIRCRTLAGGAGIYHSTGGIVIRDCHFEECDRRAVWIDADATGHEALIEGSVFLNCVGESGGGAVAVGARPGGTVLRRCTFVGNRVSGGGGGAVNVGGTGAKLIEDCVFLFNGASGSGGGVSMAGVTTLRRSTFIGNAKLTTSGGGGSIAFSTSGATGSVLDGNVIVGSLGAAAVHGTTTVGPLTSGCNVFWNNALGNASGTYSVGVTDREADPLFCDEVGGDYTLRQGSPCLPENSLGCGQIGAFGEGCGIVSIEPQSWARIKHAYRQGGRP